MAKNPNPFSKLMLNIEKMQELIELWCESNFDEKVTVTRDDIPKRVRFYVEKRAQLDFIECSEGRYTIYCDIGPNPSLSKEIANYLLSQIKNPLKDSPYANGFSTKMSEEEFDAVIGLLISDGNSIENSSEVNEPGKACYKLFRMKGIRGDHVTLKYFCNTKRLQVQGKPLYLFQDVLSLIAESIEDTDSVVDNHLEMCNLSIKKDDIYDEMKKVLGEGLFNFFPISHRAILASPFIQFRVTIDMPDYSCLVFPAYRAYEGFLRKVFTKNGLDCMGKDKNIGEFFLVKSGTTIEMKPMYSTSLTEDVENTLKSLYKYYYLNRHAYGHASGNDQFTAVISKRNDAYDKFMEVINYIKKGYTIV